MTTHVTQIPKMLRNNEITVADAIADMMRQEEHAQAAITSIEAVAHKVIHLLHHHATELGVVTPAFNQINRSFCAMCSRAIDAIAMEAARTNAWANVDMRKLHPLESYAAQISVTTPYGIGVGLGLVSDCIADDKRLDPVLRSKLAQALRDILAAVTEGVLALTKMFKDIGPIKETEKDNEQSCQGTDKFPN